MSRVPVRSWVGSSARRPQQGDQPEDGIERWPQIMGHSGQKLVLHDGELLELGGYAPWTGFLELWLDRARRTRGAFEQLTNNCTSNRNKGAKITGDCM